MTYFWQENQNVNVMWRERILTLLFALAFSIAAANAQNIDYILEFIGTDSVEEMSPYDIERLEDLLEHPVRLNYVSESKLYETGLLSRYQIASLMDYRSRHGDVMSLMELAAVDGFGHDFVARLAPFVSLDSYRLPGPSMASSMRNDISTRTNIRSHVPMTYGLKYKLTAGESLAGGLSISRTTEAHSSVPDSYSGHLACHFKRRPGKIILGDFNARFGQGLVLWNGMSFSGLTGASSFMKRPGGISASSSFTGGYSLRGIASDIGFGRLRLTALAAFKQSKEAFSLMPAINASFIFRNGQISMTHYADFSFYEESTRIPDMKTAADIAFCISGTDVFAEAAYDWVSSSFAALAGMTAPAGEDIRLAAMLRYYPSSYTSSRSAAACSTTKCSNEYSASFAADFNLGGWIELNDASSTRKLLGKVSADFAYFPEPKVHDAEMKSIQIKAQTEWKWTVSNSFRTSLRVSERIRTWGEPYRTDLRTDFTYMPGCFVVNLRLNALFCVDTGLLGYLEGGYRAEKFSAYIRSGIFRIDNWDDRIYAYERDAPGSFNVPAYYGRGVWTALTMNWKFARWGRMYIRAASTSYPFMQEKKPGRAELRVQFVFKL